MPIIPRYSDRRGLIEQIVMEAVKEHLNRRQGTDNITRNFLRFLTSVCGLIEVINKIGRAWQLTGDSNIIICPM